MRHPELLEQTEELILFRGSMCPFQRPHTYFVPFVKHRVSDKFLEELRVGLVQKLPIKGEPFSFVTPQKGLVIRLQSSEKVILHVGIGHCETLGKESRVSFDGEKDSVEALSLHPITRDVHVKSFLEVELTELFHEKEAIFSNRGVLADEAWLERPEEEIETLLLISTEERVNNESGLLLAIVENEDNRLIAALYSLDKEMGKVLVVVQKKVESMLD